ncbi:trypsin-like serine protease [Lentzea sp. PSKA42]|uniref:Trypsin-like serine protease n=1 Tax=Lentzea indica TaxID=2604800 RepID=A0ABX1FRY5_9PSEU|nr:trypsin-like serine protease [Lentzea indica]NKE61794.1 trypsin-like serine protease [Lentzea indica]
MRPARLAIYASVVLLGAPLVGVGATANAIIGGEIASPAPPWTAFLEMKTKKGFLSRETETSTCTGSLIAPQWIVTAAHCVASDPDDNGSYTVMAPKGVTVHLGQTNSQNKGQKFDVTRIETLNYRQVPRSKDNDIALLRLSKPASVKPLWVLPSPAAAPNSTPAKLYGYGWTKPYDEAKAEHQKTGTLRSTKTGENLLYTDCLVGTLGRACLGEAGTPQGGGAGDSGGPWVTEVDGSPLLSVVFSGQFLDGQVERQYGEFVGDTDTLPWLRSTTGIPDLPPGRIVRDPQTAESWLLDANGFRTSIPDGGTYECLTATGHTVTNLPGAGIALIPLRSALAECGPKKVLVFGTGDYGMVEPRNNLAATLSTAGYETEVSNSLPADLSGFGAAYHVSTDALSEQDITALVAFAKSGRGLYLTGERPCCEPLNASVTSIVNQLVVSVGGITVGNQGDPFFATGKVSVNPAATGQVATRPATLDTWTVSAPGGMANVSGDNVFAHAPDGTVPVAGVWGADDVIGGGRLAVFMDINWLEFAYWDQNSATEIALNVALFLSGYASPPQVIPAATIERATVKTVEAATSLTAAR